jgi:adenylate kinase family enzyme
MTMQPSASPRVAVIGNTGSGKTTLARKLADHLGVPHVELDALFWGPSWTMASPEEFRRSVGEAIAGEGWVVDGNYPSRLGTLVLDRADLVVWLDLPLRTGLWRIFRRTWRRIRSGEDLWGTNRETWRDAFLSRDSLFLWAVRKHSERRRTLPPQLARLPHVRLRSQREVEEWFERYVNVRM